MSAPLASFLRAYQRGGGYTPGPALAFCALAGLAASIAALFPAVRRRHQAALACLLFFTSAAAVLLVSDAFEFSWRYQLPAVITLPPAGALALTLALRGRATPAQRSTTGTDAAGRGGAATEDPTSRGKKAGSPATPVDARAGAAGDNAAPQEGGPTAENHADGDGGGAPESGAAPEDRADGENRAARDGAAADQETTADGENGAAAQSGGPSAAHPPTPEEAEAPAPDGARGAAGNGEARAARAPTRRDRATAG